MIKPKSAKLNPLIFNVVLKYKVKTSKSLKQGFENFFLIAPFREIEKAIAPYNKTTQKTPI